MTRGPIMIVAGGTGGHVFPGLAVADVLREHARGVIWMGTEKGLEARLVPQAGIEIEWITVSGLRGRGFAAWLLAPFRLLLAVGQALAAVRRRRPAAVLGMGGFVSGPGGLAAWLTGRPLLIHEQNATAGTTNRLLSRLTRHVFEAFAGSFPARCRARQIGNPVRASIVSIPAPRERFASRDPQRGAYRLLVIGGSQGARRLNEIVPAAAALLPFELDVWHQAGAEHDATRARYAATGIPPRVDAFIDDMTAAYSWADLVVCRAGALTIAELTAAGLGAILIPYPYAADDHQQKNALSFAANGAGIVIVEAELDAASLAAALGVALDGAMPLQMAELARAQARPQAAAQLAEACIELAGVRT